MSSDQRQTIPFSTVLASTVHDMKNALSVILTSLNDVTDKIKQVDPDNNKISVLRYETSRVNGLMVQLLALYKSEQNQLPLNINYHNVYDFLEELGLSYDDLLTSKNITVHIDVEEELEWTFDLDLMGMVIGNIITNAIRYTESSIVLKAQIDNGMLQISVEDDGPGYPEVMLNEQQDIILGVNQSTGSTGLGLYFAGQIATIHNRDQLQGNIKLTNGQAGGGIFTIRIA